MQEEGKTDITYRIRTWKSLCVSNGISYKSAIERAGFNYDSVINAMGSANRGNRTSISEERMREIEKATSLMLLEKLL